MKQYLLTVLTGSLLLISSVSYAQQTNDSIVTLEQNEVLAQQKLKAKEAKIAEKEAKITIDFDSIITSKSQLI